MKKVPVVFKGDCEQYGAAGIKFAFASPFANGKIRMLSSFSSCREYACQDFLKRVRGSWSKRTSQSEIEILRCRVIMQVPIKIAEADSLETTVRLLRVLEKHAGWPLTKIYELETISTHNRYYLFVSSSRWHRCQYFFSMYMLLLRSFTCAKSTYQPAKSVEDLLEILKTRKIANYMKLLPSFIKLMENFEKLTRGLSLKKLYDMEELGPQDWAFERGIHYLIGGLGNIPRKTKFRTRVAEVLGR